MYLDKSCDAIITKLDIFTASRIVCTVDCMNSYCCEHLWCIVIGLLNLIRCIYHFRCKTTMEAIHGLMSQVIKDRLFNQVHLSKP